MQSFSSFFLKNFLLLFFLKNWNFLPLESILNLLPESFNAPTQQVYIIIPLLHKIIHIFNSLLLIEMVQNNDLIFFVLVVEQLWNCFILFYPWPWEAEGLPDMIIFVFFRVSKVKQQKICLNTCWKLLSSNCYMR